MLPKFNNKSNSSKSQANESILRTDTTENFDNNVRFIFTSKSYSNVVTPFGENLINVK